MTRAFPWHGRLEPVWERQDRDSLRLRLYHGDGQLDDQNVPIKNEVGAYSLSAKSTPGLSYPITPFLNGPGTVSANADYRDRKDMYVTQWGLSVQQALPHDLVGTLSYVGSKGKFELITSYVNLIDPATGLRPYPAFGQVRWRGNPTAAPMTASLPAFSEPLPAACWSPPTTPTPTRSTRMHPEAEIRTIRRTRPVSPASAPQETSTRAMSSMPTPSTIFPSALEKPFLSQPGIASAILGRWSLTDIVAARTGTPLNITYSRSSSSDRYRLHNQSRPNLVPGVSLTPPGGKTIRGTTKNWINPECIYRSDRPGQLRRHSAQHHSRARSVADRSRGLQAHSTH